MSLPAARAARRRVFLTVSCVPPPLRSPAGGVLIDGFPRTVGQADEFVRNVSDFEFVLYFDCPEDELMRRLVGRGMTSGRSDDNVASIRKRFTTFREKCKPVVDMYAAEGRLHAIDATRGVDEIFQDLLPLFDASLATAAQ
jgi:adenylate kinase family enzyme